MTEPDPFSTADTEALIGLLHRKEGSWVQWGQACQKLQKSGINQQAIFEQTGFEPVNQNQVIVASQVYAGLEAANSSSAVLEHFARKGSDILYELRLLTQPERVVTAEFVLAKNLDVLEVKDVVKAVKDLSLISSLPEEFTRHPGDAIAYQVWKASQSKQDAQEGTRLIARGLKYAHSNSARSAIEGLLSDLVTPKKPKAPRLPIYRLEADDQVPRVIPVVGRLPLTLADLKAVPFIDEVEPFGMVQFGGSCAWVAVTGWHVVRDAQDCVAILCDTDTFKQVCGQQFPNSLPNRPEDILILVDRAQREWDDSSYFVVEQDEFLQLQWFEAPPAKPLLGRTILFMRQKKFFDEDSSKDLWQIDE